MKVLMICPELPSANKPGSMAPATRQIQSLIDSGLDVQTIDMRGIPKLKYFQVIPRVCQAIRSVDLVHAHFGYCGWLALLGRRLALRRVPIVMSFMGDDLLGTPIDEKGTLERSSVLAVKFNCRVARRYQQIIVKSPEMARRLEPLPCHVVPNGVDLKCFLPRGRLEVRNDLQWSPYGWKVLFPGDPTNPRKGYELARASVDVAEKLLGEPIELVKLWGVEPNRVADYMNACNAMLMTSLIEGSPNVVKEALACNVNVVAVPVGDVHEMLDGVNHCYRCERDPNHLGQALAEALKLGQPGNGREILQARGLSLEKVAERILSIYRQAVEASRM